MQEVPDVIYFDCPECGDTTSHDVLKGKMGKSIMEATIRCQECNSVRTTVVGFPKLIDVRTIVSNGPDSVTTTVSLEDDDLLKVGDEFFLDDGQHVRISALELDHGKRVKSARATLIKTLWCIQFDLLNIKVSINDDRKTYSKYVSASPDDEFVVGDILSFDDMDCLVHSIKLDSKMLRRGATEARDIVRIYGKYRRRSYPVLDLENESEDI